MKRRGFLAALLAPIVAPVAKALGIGDKGVPLAWMRKFDTAGTKIGQTLFIRKPPRFIGTDAGLFSPRDPDFQLNYERIHKASLEALHRNLVADVAFLQGDKWGVNPEPPRKIVWHPGQLAKCPTFSHVLEDDLREDWD